MSPPVRLRRPLFPPWHKEPEQQEDEEKAKRRKQAEFQRRLTTLV